MKLRKPSYRLLVCVSGVIGCLAALASLPSLAEESLLTPHLTDGKVLFSYEAKPGAKTVHLAGEFNEWSMIAVPMSDEDGDGIWTVAIDLEDGRWEYKFVVDGEEWVTDPHAHDTDPRGFNNGIVFIGIPRPEPATSHQSDSDWKDDSLLAPHPVGGGVLFSYEAPAGTRSVHLAGEFNQWSMTRDAMMDNDGDGIWRLMYPLEVGHRYEYKFVVNGGEWVTDPNAPETNRQNFNNGVYTFLPAGVPYAVRVHPAFGSRAKIVTPITATLMCYKDRIDPSSVQVSLNDTRLDHRYDPSTGEVHAPVPDDFPDGEHRVTFTARAVDSQEEGRTTSRFTLDRVPPVFESPDFYDTAVVYEIFVRSFLDSDGDGEGDLRGLIEKLDYLNDGDPDTDNDLGIDVIWMMPICESPSYHGYDITNYYRIEPDYGTNEDFFDLCREAHRRGIRVVFDYVVNHSAKAHPFLQDAYGNPDSRYSSWYRFTNREQTSYEGFAGWDGMPLLNFETREMRDYIIEMAFYWMDPDGDGDFADGVDGFRCDVAKGPPHEWWKELRRSVKSKREDFLLFGEVWDGSPDVLDEYFDEEYDMQFDYPLYYRFLDLLNNGAIDDFDWMLEEERTTFPPEAQICRFLDNHDNDRTLSALGEDERLNRLGTLFLLTLPGTPMLYYGEEIGMVGSNPPDQRVRRPMEWKKVERQMDDPGSLLSRHRRLIQLRKQYPALSARHDSRRISYRRLMTDNMDIYAYLRSSEGETPVLVIGNMSKWEIGGTSLKCPLSNVKPGDYRLSEIFPGSEQFMKIRVQEDGSFGLSLPKKLGRHEGIVLILE
ncbi:MAG: hypothetical protein KAW17_10265 [Candidatus Eisenbacteria sp.]|nr:hypothetical protein [Candidatus Eisenbacteria bacterium]